MTKIQHIKDFIVSPVDSYFFDANVWIYIYGVSSGYEKKKQEKYSQLYRDILDRKASLFITALVLSELVNRILRIDFEGWKKSQNRINASFKKDFRNSETYKDSLNNIKEILKEIYHHSERRPDDFNSIDFECIINNISNKQDFNDLYLAKICEKNKLILVTEDKDFCSYNGDLTILL